jgi:thiosulfate dehydrogenase
VATENSGVVVITFDEQGIITTNYLRPYKMHAGKQNKPAKISKDLRVIAAAVLICAGILTGCVSNSNNKVAQVKQASPQDKSMVWKGPDSSAIPTGKAGNMIRYGRELIAHTAQYLGPKGSVAQISNGMNCQNCHLDAGNRVFGNDYAGFIAGYPKISNRSGRVERASQRITECFERSLGGTAPDTSKKEMKAILAYMTWMGKNVKKGQKIFGTATERLVFMDHPADPSNGKNVFIAKCASCHGSNGEGMLAVDKVSYTNPPLWGKNSYNDGAGMYRVINLAGFVKNNMPFGATYQNPQLTDEEAWNVAAFINSQPRPHKDQQQDWPTLDKKPIDFPFGPYADHFSEKQHKYGPFKPIKDAQKIQSILKS